MYYTPLLVHKCETAKVLVDEEEVGEAKICWFDKVSWTDRGVEKVIVMLPVMIDNEIVGEARIELDDAYDMSLDTYYRVQRYNMFAYLQLMMPIMTVYRFLMLMI
jgi:hypothetical protein